MSRVNRAAAASSGCPEPRGPTLEAPADRAVERGDRLGQYQVLGRLAAGGMSEIFLARALGDEGFEKLVVLKRILPRYARDERFVSMFLDEARLAAALSHPNLAFVHDIGIAGGHYFFCMEYVPGQDLGSVARAAHERGRPVPLALAVRIVADVCGALHHAHEKTGSDGLPLGVVHRDVSPANVLVGYDGSVKLIDFGIARMTARDGGTDPGRLAGKAGYMAPEQWRGEAVDRRSDIFSLGVVLYELTTGSRLFPVEDEAAAMRQIVSRPAPPPSASASGYPAALERIVVKALRRHPDERYATAEAMQLDLERFARERRLDCGTVALGRFVEELFGKGCGAGHAAPRQARSPGVRRAGPPAPATAPSGSRPSAPPRAGAGPSPSGTPDRRPAALDFDLDLHIGAVPALPRRRWRAKLVAAAALVGVTLGILGVVSRGHGDASPGGGPPAAAVATPAPMAETPAEPPAGAR